MELTYQARDQQGNLQTGTVEAATEAAAFDMLQNHGLIVVKITSTDHAGIFDQFQLFKKVPMKDMVLFSRQLSTLINAKVPIVQSLKVLQAQVSSGQLKAVLAEVAVRVENGDSLSSAIALYPKVFSELYVNLVKAGELSGTMDESLEYLANQMERDYDLRSKVIGALTYPAFIVGALVVVGFLMFIYVLPPLISVLEEAAVEMPIATKILVAATGFMQTFWWLILLIVIGTAVGLRSYSKTHAGRYAIDAVKIKLPLFGGLYQKIYMARFARNLGTLVAGGIPIVRALESVANIVGNVVYRDIILDASHQVGSGKSIASVLSQRPEFPVIVSQMTQVGESTGRLQEILEKLASFYEKEVEAVLKILTTLIEPIIMMLLGLAVAVMVAGILLPIYNLASGA